MHLRTADQIINKLIDIVSKSGILLLNICPKADGSIPTDQQNLLQEIGDWLKINGEAIYASRPGSFMAKVQIYTAHYESTKKDEESIRFTTGHPVYRQGEVLYLIVMGWPAKKSSPVVAGQIDGFQIENNTAWKIRSVRL